MTRYSDRFGYPPEPELPPTYGELHGAVRAELAWAPATTVRCPNAELIRRYWRIGRSISEWQQRERFGRHLYARLAADLAAEFPDHKGYAAGNLRAMQRLAEAWPDGIGLRAVGRLPWRHILVLIDSDLTTAERDFYALRTVEYGWSRNVLIRMIEIDLHHHETPPLPDES